MKLILERSISALELNPKGPKSTAEKGLRTGQWGRYQSGLNKPQLATGCPRGAPRGLLARSVSPECLQ